LRTVEGVLLEDQMETNGINCTCCGIALSRERVIVADLLGVDDDICYACEAVLTSCGSAAERLAFLH
jgi:hypothetical protein